MIKLGSIFLFTLGLLSFQTARASNLTCELEGDHSWESGTKISIQTKGNRADLKVLRGSFTYELASINPTLKLVTKGSSSSQWLVEVYESNNSDDTSFLISLVTASNLETARVNIQIFVDGLEGGTRSYSLECSKQ